MSVMLPSMLDGQPDNLARNEQLESRVHRKVHARFGGGRMEKGVKCTSPAAYPTHVLGTMRTLSHLEGVTETERDALNILASVNPGWVLPHTDATWVDRYGSRARE